MKPILTPAQMYALEKAYFAAGNPSLPLMEKAASCVVEEAERMLGGLSGKRIAVICGGGNNGGDGCAAAWMARAAGAQVCVVPFADEHRGDAGTEWEKCAQAGIPEKPYFQVERPDLWIDALLGIGCHSPLGASYRPLLERLEEDRSRGSLVLSVDLPSGVPGLTGETGGMAVRADRTVTFHCAKYGHYFGDGPDHTGEVVVRDIGLPQPDEALLLADKEDVRRALPVRRRFSHKGTYGHLLAVAGSFGMAGAAVFCANAALRMGVGLVTVACPRSIVPVLQVKAPEAMCLPLPERDGAIAPEAAPLISEALSGKTAVAVGPGLSRLAAPEAVEAVLRSNLPVVADADALNLIAREDTLRGMLREGHVITPHPGEARRLMPDLTGTPVEQAQTLSDRLGCTALLKGSVSVIARQGKRPVLSASGGSALAKGGSGDVLTGMTGALMAQGLSPFDAAWAASELHGLAGEAAADRLSPECFTAQDVIASIDEAFKRVRRT